MSLRRVAAALTLALAPACSRSGLELDERTPVTGRDASPAPSATATATATGTTTPSPPTTALDCTSKVAPDAPAAMEGLCGTRAYRSRATAPATAPTPDFVLATGAKKQPSDPLVDSQGNAWVTLDLTDDSAIVSHALAKVTPGGTIKVHDFGHPIARRPVLAQRDGKPTVVVWNAQGAGRFLSFVDMTYMTDGGTVPLPSDAIARVSVLSDGRIVLMHTTFNDALRLGVYTQHGELLHETPPVGSYVSDFAVSADDRLVVAGGVMGALRVMSFLPSGEVVFDRSFPDTNLVGGPAIGADGRVVLSVGEDGFKTAALRVLSAGGDDVLHVPLGQPNPGGTQLVVAKDGSSYVRGWDTLFAFDPTGKVLFTRDVHPNLVYGATLDATGRLLLTTGDTKLLDGKTGEVAWTLDPPMPFSCLGAVSLGLGGELWFTQCDGTVGRATAK